MVMAKSPSRPSSRGTKRRGEPVVREVFEIALEQLAAQGFERLSLPEIAALAGLNKTSLYRRWPTKVDLVREALTASLGNPDALPDTGDVRSDLLAMARAAVAFVESPMGMAVHQTLLAESTHPEVREIAATISRQQETAGPRLVLRRAIARGDLPNDVDAKLLLTTIAGALMHRVFVEHVRVTDRFLEGLIDLVLFGAKARPRESRGPAQRRG